MKGLSFRPRISEAHLCDDAYRLSFPLTSIILIEINGNVCLRTALLAPAGVLYRAQSAVTGHGYDKKSLRLVRGIPVILVSEGCHTMNVAHLPYRKFRKGKRAK